jgi:FAD/FMN-containing dehydrogenase
MAVDDATLIDALARIVGRDHVLTRDVEVAPYVIDWRGRYHGDARAIVRPAKSGQVAAIVAHCLDDRIQIVPQGGNTGM